ncbi:MAG TPA: fosfomycin resistance glutathione transferase [Paucimonas sp.]|nr:fosfomycin resistance glutathione transferase [Paucimonas sp.]
MLTGINHITLSVSDLDRSFAFYADILGLRPIARWKQGAHLECGKDWLCLSLDRATRKAPLPEYTHLAFSIAQQDFEAFCGKLARQGILPWKDNKSEGDSYYFLDPDGHRLEIHVGDLASRLASLPERSYEGLVLFEQEFR